MNLVKQYIIQSISAASNNLRLNTQKIEVVALLRETILKSQDLNDDIKKMKKVTELSTLAIRLSEIHNYLTQGVIDFFKISEKFKEHSHYLIKDLSHMLDMVNPVTFKQALEKMNPPDEEPVVKATENNIPENLSEIRIDFSKRHTDAFTDYYEINTDEDQNKKTDENDLIFRNFEESILQPIKPIESFLKNFDENKTNTKILSEYAELIKKNGEKSEKAGFEVLSNMHNIVALSLKMIINKDIEPTIEIIESIRACLIVIVAVVRGKEVDITHYLSKAESFGKQINLLNKGLV